MASSLISGVLSELVEDVLGRVPLLESGLRRALESSWGLAWGLVNDEDPTAGSSSACCSEDSPAAGSFFVDGFFSSVAGFFAFAVGFFWPCRSRDVPTAGFFSAAGFFSTAGFFSAAGFSSA